MTVDLSTLTWPAVSSLTSAGIALCAFLYAVFSPRHREKKAKAENASLLRCNVRLYLDVLSDKIGYVRHNYQQQDRIKAFEEQTNQNHDAIEEFSLHSEPLHFEERMKLLEFVRYYKSAPYMQEADFKVYQEKLNALLALFPAMK